LESQCPDLFFCIGRLGHPPPVANQCPLGFSLSGRDRHSRCFLKNPSTSNVLRVYGATLSAYRVWWLFAFCQNVERIAQPPALLYKCGPLPNDAPRKLFLLPTIRLRATPPSPLMPVSGDLVPTFDVVFSSSISWLPSPQGRAKKAADAAISHDMLLHLDGSVSNIRSLLPETLLPPQLANC